MPTAGRTLHRAPANPRTLERLAQGFAIAFFVISVGLSLALAMALVYLVLSHPSISGDSDTWSLGITGRIALWAVISWVPTLLLLTLVNRLRHPPEP